MNKNLQKLILKIIRDNNGIAERRVILNKTKRNYWDKIEQPSLVGKFIKNPEDLFQEDKITTHQLDLLQKSDKVIRENRLPDIFYILTPSGHQEFDPLYIKLWRFVLYDKHNLFFILSLIISVISLIIALKK